jgi:vacuolar protein sorting-associated protein 53
MSTLPQERTATIVSIPEDPFTSSSHESSDASNVPSNNNGTTSLLTNISNHTSSNHINHGGSDPVSLLDSLDAYTSSRSSSAAAVLGTSTASSSAWSSMSLDPVDFLNRHFTNEHILQSQLPSLRMAVLDRIESLEDRISTALQRQSETSQATRQHVQDAKASITSLETRIRLVQHKASQSEKAVLEITKDMKRLDCAKRHLQKTITTLKQLHMLVHAVEQLRLACLLKPFCDYKAASQLVDAIRLLLKHFEAYTVKVQPMRLLNSKVYAIQNELLQGLIRGFRMVGLGVTRAMELEQRETTSHQSSTPAASSNLDASGHQQDLIPTSNSMTNDDDDSITSVSLMTPQVMADGTHLIDSLGADTRSDFLRTISHDHLVPYEMLFLPKPPSNKANSIKQHSFKKAPEEEVEIPPYSLDQVDRRFAWYRRTLRDLCDKFPGVFPVYWNFQYFNTVYFLEMVRGQFV